MYNAYVTETRACELLGNSDFRKQLNDTLCVFVTGTPTQDLLNWLEKKSGLKTQRGRDNRIRKLQLSVDDTL